MKYAVLLDGQVIEVDVDGERVTVDGRTFTATLGVIPGTPLRQLLLDGRPSTAARSSPWAGAAGPWRPGASDGRWRCSTSAPGTFGALSGSDTRQPVSAVLKAPMPGLVLRIQVAAGQAVAAEGGGLVVLEAMKMENELKAPARGRGQGGSRQPGRGGGKGSGTAGVRAARGVVAARAQMAQKCKSAPLRCGGSIIRSALGRYEIVMSSPFFWVFVAVPPRVDVVGLFYLWRRRNSPPSGNHSRDLQLPVSGGE